MVPGQVAMTERSDEPSSRTRFDVVYARNYDRILRVVYALSGDWQTAEEATQEAFIKAMRRWDTVGDYDQPDAWIRKVAINMTRSRFRRLTREVKALSRLASNSRDSIEHPEMNADAARFWNAVRGLPRRQAEAIALHYADDLTVVKVAQVMGCAEGTVKAHLHAARQRLAAHYPTQGRETDR